jgi:hypothetical protein
MRPVLLNRVGIAAVAVILMSCHGPLAVGTALHAPGSEPGWIDDPGLPIRASAAAEAMAVVWGGAPSDLGGWTITFRDRFIARNGTAMVVGKTTRKFIIGGGSIEVWAGTSLICLEATDLAHEVGHVVIRDHDHRDPRWLDRTFWDRMAKALRAMVPPEDLRCREQLSSGIGIWH